MAATRQRPLQTWQKQPLSPGPPALGAALPLQWPLQRAGPTTEKAEEDSCVFDLGHCEDFEVREDAITFTVKNDFGQEITVTDAEISGCESGSPWMIEEITFPADEYNTIDISSCNLDVGTKAYLDIELTYQKAGEQRISTGRINAMVIGEN